MGKIIDVFWFLFIIIEFFIIIITFCYLKREYVKALTNYYSKNAKVRKYCVIKKEEARKNIIKMNVTQYIDTQEINRRIGYAQLVFSSQGNYIASEKLFQNRIKIGRDSSNDIIIKDYTVSRKQCQIIKRDGKFILKNISKRNVTRLNNKVVKNSKEIKYGDIIKIGNIKFEFDNVLEVI